MVDMNFKTSLDFVYPWGHSEPAPTHQPTIHWMPVFTQLWMNLNWVNIWFHLGNPFCKK
jgi:hypothetical protein